jgi:adenylosuccinate synthase
MGYAERLAPHVADTSKLLYDALRAGKHVMLEGAQGTLLDLDHGTYPFVTSSSPVAGGALASAGLGPGEVTDVIGVTKAYVTRVGAGPFPTEDTGPDGELMGERGQEFGTTTGRKRRCGWFDAVLLRFAARINGFTELFLTKLDVLTGLDPIKVCVAYRCDDETYDDVPPHQSTFHKAEPVYEELEGWDDDLGDVSTYVDLPAAARKYVDRIVELADVPISLVSVGPAREQSLRVE